MKSCDSRKGSGQEMGNYEFNWSGLIYCIYCMFVDFMRIKCLWISLGFLSINIYMHALHGEYLQRLVFRYQNINLFSKVANNVTVIILLSIFSVRLQMVILMKFNYNLMLAIISNIYNVTQTQLMDCIINIVMILV